MPLTPTANWTAAFAQSSVADRFYVEITDNTPTTWSAVSGTCDQIDAPESVQGVAAISAELDPLTREVQTGQIDVTFDDAFLRPIIVANRITQAQITVTLGARELASADFISYFSGIIDSIHPSDDKQGITVSCLDAFGMLKTREIVGYWFNQHPLQIIKDILDKAGVPAGLYDATSLDPSQAQYTTIKHFNMSRIRPVVGKPTNAWELVQEVAELINGQFITTAAGKLSFVLFDNSASTDFAWDADTLLSFSTREVHSRILNEFTVNFSRLDERTDKLTEHTQKYLMRDDDSQGNYAYPGESDRIMAESLTTDWLDQQVVLAESIDNSQTTGIIIQGASLPSFCGMCYSGNSTLATKPSWTDLGASNKLYVDLDGEVITATGYTFGVAGTTLDNTSGYSYVIDPADGVQDQLGKRPSIAELTGVTRGSSPVAHDGWDRGAQTATRVYDVTIPQALSEAKIERFGDGIDVIEVTVDLREFPATLGDVGTVTDDTFVRFGKDGTDTGDKWEIIGKELDLDAKEIRYTLASAETASPTTSFTTGSISTSGLEAVRTLDAGGGGSFSAGVGTGFELTASGLDVTVAAGTSVNGSLTSHLNADATITVDASRDTYLYRDVVSGAVSAISVATAAAEPPSAPTEHLIGMVVAGASSVTLRTEQVSRSTATVSTGSNEAPRSGNLITNGNFSQVKKG